jgi:hypothetical protein
MSLQVKRVKVLGLTCNIFASDFFYKTAGRCNFLFNLRCLFPIP